MRSGIDRPLSVHERVTAGCDPSRDEVINRLKEVISSAAKPVGPELLPFGDGAVSDQMCKDTSAGSAGPSRTTAETERARRRALRSAEASVAILEPPRRGPTWSPIEYVEDGVLPPVPKGLDPHIGLDAMDYLARLQAPERQQRTRALADYLARGMGLLFGLAEDSPNRFQDRRLAEALGIMDHPSFTKHGYPRVSYDSLQRFLDQHRDLVVPRLQRVIVEALEDEPAYLIESARKIPQASKWELIQSMRMVAAVHTEQDLVAHYQRSGLSRPVDRLGRTPLQFVMASLALAMYRAPAGSTEDEVISAWRARYPSLARELDLSTASLKRLFGDFSLIYNYVKTWKPQQIVGLSLSYRAPTLDLPPRVKGDDDLGLEELHPLARQALLDTGDFEFESRMALALRERCPEPSAMAGRKLVAIEHALTNKVPQYLDMILNEGIRGDDIWVIVKPGSADPSVIKLLQDMCGIHVDIARDDADLDKLFRTRVEALYGAGHRDIDMHVMGTHSWPWIAQFLREHPDLSSDQVSHTTSDCERLVALGGAADHLFATRMADSQAKRSFERYMHGLGLRTLFEQLPEELDGQVPDIHQRHVLLHGGLGKIMAGGMLDALLQLAAESPGAPPFTRITIIDPRVDSPEERERCAQLRSLGVRLVKGTEIPDELMNEKLLAINCTAQEVWHPKDYARLRAADLVLMNLGTGQTGFSMGWLEKACGGPSQVIDKQRNQPHCGYQLHRPDGSQGPTIYALGKGHPYNLLFRKPNPEALSQFNNLMILESLRQAAWCRRQGCPGPSTLGSVRVSFSADQPPRPVIVFIDRDLPPDLPWPEVWPDSVPLDGSDCAEVTGATLVFWRSQTDPRGRDKVLDLYRASGIEVSPEVAQALRQPFDEHGSASPGSTPDGRSHPTRNRSRLVTERTAAGTDPAQTVHRVTSLSQARDLLARAKVVFFDGDKVLYRPTRGYFLSENWEWDTTSRIARERGIPESEARGRVLRWRAIMEAMMLEDGRFELGAGVTASDLQSLRQSGTRVIMVTARPQTAKVGVEGRKIAEGLEGRCDFDVSANVNGMLRASGVGVPGDAADDRLLVLDEVHFVGGLGKKMELIAERCARLGISCQEAALIDDRAENLAGVAELGALGLHLVADNSAYQDITAQGYLARARAADDPNERLWELVNAQVAAARDGDGLPSRLVQNIVDRLPRPQKRRYRQVMDMLANMFEEA